MYTLLRSEGHIGRLAIPNRVVMTAMGVNLASADGSTNDDIIAYYEARARGGAGLIISEITRITDGAGTGEPCQLASYRMRDVASLQRLIDAVHKYGTKIFIQLQHPGMQASPLITGEIPVAPSALLNPDTGVTSRELSTEECKELVGKFISAACWAKCAGADGVELHGAHGYLISSFLSPAMNLREDEYGGGFEGRMRFVLEIIEGIKKKCGPFAISVRINAEERAPEGIDLPLAKKIAKALEDAGVDVINVSCFSLRCIEPGTYPQGSKQDLTSAIKESVEIPVIGVSNIKEPDVAEELLKEGVSGFIGLGRALLADPEWPKKAFTGRASEIRTCIGCLSCFGEISAAKHVKCAVNPITAREREFANPVEDGNGRTVAVIGGGPAGIEAALTLAERKFSPVLFDNQDQLGGTLNAADKGYGKEKITMLVDSLSALVKKAGIEVRLGEEATPETVAKIDPCGVFVACGADNLVPPIPGLEGSQVCTAQDILLGKVKPTGEVAVIGSGVTGLETAEVLAMNGCKVSLVEMLNQVGAGVYPLVITDIMSRLQPLGAEILTGHKLLAVKEDGVELSRLADGENVFVKTDCVVLSMGVCPRTKVANSFKEAFANVHVVGDARIGGRILEAMQDARGQAFVFDPVD